MSFFFKAKHYLRYRFSSKTEYDVHAPFAYDFYTKAIRNKQNLGPEFKAVESLRKQLLKNHTRIAVTDLGTGADDKHSQRKISRITRRYASSRKNARLLYNIAQYCKPERILELGTSVGISTMYLALANKNTAITTLEGCPQTAAIARQNFEQMHLNIGQITGNFDNILPEYLAQNPPPDLIYFDGNHTEEATLRYFSACLQGVHEKSVFVFNDIRWSPGMFSAWNHISNHPEVSLSIDIFEFGIVFFRKNSAKQHFILRY